MVCGNIKCVYFKLLVKLCLKIKIKVHWHYNFLTIFFNYRKTWFHVNDVKTIVLFCAFFLPFRQSIFFTSFFWNQNKLGFKGILEIKLLDKSIVSKKRMKEKQRKTDMSIKTWRQRHLKNSDIRLSLIRYWYWRLL